MSSKTISASVLFDFEKVEYTKENIVHMDVILTAPEKDTSKRVPLQIILSVDCSGSMSGGKLESVKETASKLIKHLTENDTLGIVGFSDGAFEVLPTIPMTSDNKSRATQAISALRTIGGTNISSAYQMSLEKAVTAEKDKISRIILLTDGLPTDGLCNIQQLVEMVGRGNPTVTLTTFGYGNDYNAELLASMASIGKGNNFYIQSQDDCNNAFALELGGLLSLYGQDIKVTFTPSGNIKINDLLSGYKLEEKAGYRGITPGSVSFTIDDIFSGESKHSVLKLTIPEATEAVCARPTRVCDIEIDYLDVDSKERVKINSTAKIQYVKTGKANKQANTEVQKQLAMIEVVRLQKEAKDKADKGDFKGAQVVLDQGLTYVNGLHGLMGPKGTAGFNGMFQKLKTSCESRYSYSTLGTKQFSSYSTSLSKGRGSSGDTLNMVYCSSVMGDMMESFKDPTPSSGTGTIKGDNITISSGNSGTTTGNNITVNPSGTSDLLNSLTKSLKKNKK